MIGAAVAWLVRRGVSERAAPIVLGVAAILLVLAGFGIWLALHDRRVIADHEQAETAKRAERTVDAERTANTRSEARRESDRRNQEDLRHAQDDAERRDPTGAAGAVGPATGAVVDELRRQRDARPTRAVPD